MPLRRLVWRGLLAATLVTNLVIACGGSETPPGPTVMCGAGTVLRGSTCVVTDGGKASIDARSDGRTHVDAFHADSQARVDANRTDGGADAWLDAVPVRDVRAETDTGMSSIPVSCSDVNTCFGGDGAPRPYELPPPTNCTLPGVVGTSVSGDRSEWIHVIVQDACMAGWFVSLTSSFSAPFGLEIYVAQTSPATSCPALTVSLPPMSDEGVPYEYLDYGLLGTREVYLHVIAADGAACATGATWTLLVS